MISLRVLQIWLIGRSEANLRFFLFTTGSVSGTSFLRYFLPDPPDEAQQKATRSQLVEDALDKTKSDLIANIAVQYRQLNESEKEDFLFRIVIFDNAPRIVDLPSVIKDQHMRSIRRECREAVFNLTCLTIGVSLTTFFQRPEAC